MLKVLIVDDEPLIREGIKKLIDWNKYNVIIAGEAHNGEIALSELERTQIDCIITDIRMPVMNGLELIQKSRQIQPNLKIVVLSAYDEFHLVKEAFKMGVTNYILKSEITEEEIIEVMDKIQKELKISRGEKTILWMEEHLKDNIIVLKDKLLKDIVWGKRKLNELTSIERKDYELQLSGSKYCILFIKICGHQTKQGNTASIDLKQYQFKMLTIFYHLLKDKQAGNCFSPAPDEYVVLTSYKKQVDWRTAHGNFRILLNEIQSELDKFGLHETASAGMSSFQSNPDQLRVLYQQAETASAYFFIHGKGKLISYASIADKNQLLSPEIEHFPEELETILKSRNSSLIRAAACNLSINTLQLSICEINRIKRLFDKYSLHIAAFLDKNSLANSERIRETLERFTSTIRESEDLHGFNCWFRLVLSQIASTLEQNSLIVTRTLEYIHNHFCSNISLDQIADYLEISVSHLSRVFSLEVNTSIYNYITKIRIEKATEYLQHSEMKIYEIADAIGYGSPEHFSRVFKKVIGKSPKKYMN